MTLQRLHSALAPLDVLTRLELEAELSKGAELAERARVRGIDYMEFNGNGQGAATVSIQGPESGYAWSLKIVSAVVSQACTFLLYMGDNTITAPIGKVQTSGADVAIVTFTSNIAIVRDARYLTLTVSAGGIAAYKLIAKQVPDEMVGKLLCPPMPLAILTSFTVRSLPPAVPPTWP